MRNLKINTIGAIFFISIIFAGSEGSYWVNIVSVAVSISTGWWLQKDYSKNKKDYN